MDSPTHLAKRLVGDALLKERLRVSGNVLGRLGTLERDRAAEEAKEVLLGYIAGVEVAYKEAMNALGPAVQGHGERPTLAEMFLEMAEIVARRSTCERLQVGCVITNMEGTTVHSIGYNGQYRGGPNTCDNSQAAGGCGCLHAEENALIKTPYGPPLTMYVTHSPCLMCAKRIINSGVGAVYYGREYRLTEGVELLRSANLLIYTPEEQETTGVGWT